MTDAPVYLTDEGITRLEAELGRLLAERPRVAERIAEAVELGDLSENADYDQAKRDQGFLEGRIATIQQQLRNAQRIAATRGKRIGIGSRVQLRAEDGEQLALSIVGSAEASPRDGRISNESPIGKALLGHTAGETVEVQAPGGLMRWTIVKVG